MDLANGRWGIPSLDHVDDAGSVPDDAAVAARLVEHGGPHGDGRPGPAMGGQELLQVGGGDRVEVAVGDKDIVRLAHCLLGELHSVTGAELLGLLDENGGGLQPPGLHGISDVVGAVTDHHDDPLRFRRAHRLKDVPEERAPAQGVQDLGDPRLQSFAFPRGEHHGGERSGCALGCGAHVRPSGLIVHWGHRGRRAHASHMAATGAAELQPDPGGSRGGQPFKRSARRPGPPASVGARRLDRAGP